MPKFPLYIQPDHMDCGPTCIRMIAKYYGKSISLDELRKQSETTREGSSLNFLASASENIGFKTLAVKIDFNTLLNDVPMPCIIHWDNNHYVVVYDIKVKKNKTIVYVADPAFGKIQYTEKEFIEKWIGKNATNQTEEGIVLVFEPTPRLYETELDQSDDKKSFKFLFKYLFRYKRFVTQLIIGVVGVSIIQLIFPFLTQSLVDIGIQNQDVDFIYMILLAQLFLFLGKIGIEAVRSWILLHLGTRINISLISDFFIKLMKLPISYFDVKVTGDILQRIKDHSRVKELLTTTSLNTFFSLFSLVILGSVLAFYSINLFSVFLIGSVVYFGWIYLFLKKRKELDYRHFSQYSDEQSKVIELITGMQEIKLHSAERQKRWGWEFIQARIFKLNIKLLSLVQKQNIGASFINELKNILITVLAAKLVIDGSITLGMMLSISYIIGNLNGPIEQLNDFILKLQDAKIALERLSEILSKEDEDFLDENKNTEVDLTQSIRVLNLKFRYTGGSETILKGINLYIPAQKTTAIVGASGSGKTTLMKLLLKFYDNYEGNLSIGNVALNDISQEVWRDHCGVVMQEGFIFNDTIANNIAVGETHIDKLKLIQAVEIASIKSFIDELPLGYNTKIGQDGLGISTGQKQRLLIARAVYKNPDIIFFDEATSALDAYNERVVMERLNLFLEDRTAIVIAHRLSTVKNADQIVVLDKGSVAEIGTHTELVAKKGVYFNLVKDQLELEKINA